MRNEKRRDGLEIKGCSGWAIFCWILQLCTDKKATTLKSILVPYTVHVVLMNLTYFPEIFDR